jgi:hypothetical protein
MEFREVVGNRRSIRSYADRPVEMEKIQVILEAARLAPWVLPPLCQARFKLENMKNAILRTKSDIRTLTLHCKV